MSRYAGGKYYFVGVNDFDLIDFCSKDSSRWFTGSPWLEDGSTIATNSACLVIIHSEIQGLPTREELENAGHKIPVGCEGIINYDLEQVANWQVLTIDDCSCGLLPCECKMQIGDSHFARALVLLFSRFSDVRVGYATPTAGEHSLVLRFHEGRGMIMPLGE